MRRQGNTAVLVTAFLGCALLLGCVWHSTITSTMEHQQKSGLFPSLKSKQLGAIVFLAPQRTASTWWYETPRFCFLMRAVRSVDEHLNKHYGPYPIYLLIAKDYHQDPSQKDAPYTDQDRALIRSWAPRSQIIFQEINLYSEDALEPDTTVQQIANWRKGNDGGTEGRDLGYQSMCRLWSGRLQTMPFLQAYQLYMRMDDDSLLMARPPFDPFVQMQEKGLDYAYRRNSIEHWGVKKLVEIMQKHVDLSTGDTPFTQNGRYFGAEPYNNFHISRVSFWSSPQWQAFWNALNEEHAFFKYRLGDANVHAVAIMMLGPNRYKKWSSFPYVHNTNDMPKGWGKKEWKLECESAAAEQKMKD